MLGTILKVGYLCSGKFVVSWFVFFFFFLKVRPLQKNSGQGEWKFQVDSVQFVSELLILTNKSSISTAMN